LDRLNLATRGKRGSGGTITPAAGTLDSSQKWVLDMLGNWEDKSSSTPAPGYVRDFNGNGVFTDTADLKDARAHNLGNEITQTTLRGSIPFVYDDAGNLRSATLESSGVVRSYIHDAWNRLVEVGSDNGTPTDLGDDPIIARYAYNGLHWRVLKWADLNPAVPASGLDATDRMEAMVYDASWRLIQREVFDGFDPAETSYSTWKAERAEELFWGARYIDDIVARKLSKSFDGSGETISVEWAEEGPQWYLTDAQFSVVGLVDNAAGLIERVRYTPYGEARQLVEGDFNGSGTVGVTDLTDYIAAYVAATPKPLVADFNRSGTVGVDDLAAFIAAYSSGVPVAPDGWVSSPDLAGGGSDSVVGYCGYVFNHETADYTVRFRHYSPGLGRWLERDPAGDIDGATLYEYACGRTPISTDAFGLDGSSEDGWRLDLHDHGAPHFQKGKRRYCALRLTPIPGTTEALTERELYELIEQYGDKMLKEFPDSAISRTLQEALEKVALEKAKAGAGCLSKKELKEIVEKSLEEAKLVAKELAEAAAKEKLSAAQFIKRYAGGGKKILGRVLPPVLVFLFIKTASEHGVAYACVDTIVPVDLVKSVTDSVQNKLDKFVADGKKNMEACRCKSTTAPGGTGVGEKPLPGEPGYEEP